MTARDIARRLRLQTCCATVGAAALLAMWPACYSAAGGTAPPTDEFYFPVGLAVSGSGNILYAANSDFDLQWNGGTIQSYDLYHLRRDVATLVNANVKGAGSPEALSIQNGLIPFVSFDAPFAPCLGAAALSTPPREPGGARAAVGQICAPPVNSAPYQLSSVVIGAFATDLQLSRNGSRLFAPVRGDGTLTWADVQTDVPMGVTPPSPAAPQAPSAPPGSYGVIACGQGGDQRCDALHHVGATADHADTRLATLPGEPFAMAQTEDGTAISITHQTSNQTSLLLTGRAANFTTFDFAPSAAMGDGGAGAAVATPPEAGADPPAGTFAAQPSMQFVLSGVPLGGDGIAAVPHDPDALVPPCEVVGDRAPCIRPAFLETNHSTAELDLLRYYDDFGSSEHRPFLVREAAYPLTVNTGGTDSRDIVIDPTPRLACKALGSASPEKCAELPARVFFASRTPPSLVVGQIGQPSISGGLAFNPDGLVITHNIPLTSGPSRLYLAPIVDRGGHYALRVFILCFDAAQLFVYDPDADAIENVINTGPGPFAMAFDPFDMQQVAAHAAPPPDSRYDASLNLKTYRFAYLASFTQSFVQVFDLDDSLPDTSNTTFESVVFNLGQPTNPKGT